MLEIGTKAPVFTLSDASNNRISLSDFLGKKVILYFYPRDNTPGCTKQACGFASHHTTFEDKNIVVIGISKDSVASHQKFTTKFNLPFVLLSDPEKEVILAYDVWIEKKLYGKLGFGIQRATYVIDENGIILHAMPKVKAASNAEDIIELLNL